MKRQRSKFNALALQEGCLSGVPAEEVTEHVDGVTRATRLQDASSVFEPSSRIEGTIGGFHEDGGEHVCAEDLTPEIAVVLSVVTSSEMTETSSEVGALSLLYSSQFPSQFLEHISSADL